MSQLQQTKYSEVLHPYTFEKAREAVLVLKTLRPTLTSAEAETLSILLDSDAMDTIEHSVQEAQRGIYEPIASAVNS